MHGFRRYICHLSQEFLILVLSQNYLENGRKLSQSSRRKKKEFIGLSLKNLEEKL
jgi:hypothetical protein